MFAKANKGKKYPPAISVVLFLLLQMFALSCFADTGKEKPLTLIIRQDHLAALPPRPSPVLATSRNPFVWPPQQKARLEQLAGPPRSDPYAGLALNGIIWATGNPLVIINNQQLRRGDMIKGITIREITRDSVVLTTPKTRRTLKFPDSGIDLSTQKAEVE